MRQASLLILQLTTMGHVGPKDMVMLEIIDHSVSLQLKHLVDDIWSVKSCWAVTIRLQSLSHFSPVRVRSNSDKEHGLAVVSYNSHRILLELLDELWTPCMRRWQNYPTLEHICITFPSLHSIMQTVI
jgi:hypothetical protein